MKKLKKKYETPKRPWDKERIETEGQVLKKFGLRRKKEIWRAEALLRKFRRMARVLSAKKDKEQEKVLIGKLIRLGILEQGATIDDVLGLGLDDVLERRLQIVVLRQGKANTAKQARQFITHGHVSIDNRRIVYPSYIVPKNEEGKIKVVGPIQKKTVSENEAKRA